MTQDVKKKSTLVKTLTRRVLPAVISVAILVYYFRNQEWEKLLQSTENANIWLAVLAILIPQLIFWYVEAMAVHKSFEWFHGPFPFWDYFWVKGTGYILLFINTALGASGILIYQKVKADISMERFLGILLFRSAMLMWGVCIASIPFTLALHYYGHAGLFGNWIYAWWALLIFGAYWFIEAWIVWHYKKSFGIAAIIANQRENDFWTAFHNSKPKHWIYMWAMMFPPFFITLIGYYFVTIAFNVDVPFFYFIVVIPMAIAIMDLPIAFAGFGTATIAWNAFFGDYGTAADIAALTLFIPICRTGVRILMGIISIKPAADEIGTLMDARKQSEQINSQS
jgi:hypothetical protein